MCCASRIGRSPKKRQEEDVTGSPGLLPVRSSPASTPPGFDSAASGRAEGEGSTNRPATPRAARERMQERLLDSPLRQRVPSYDKETIRKEAIEQVQADAEQFFKEDKYHWRSPSKAVEVTAGPCEADEAAWLTFEELVAALPPQKKILLEDVPFPTGLDSKEVYDPKTIKQLMMRWHPDKFHQKYGKLLDQEERFLIKSRVKDAFQQLQQITTAISN